MEKIDIRHKRILVIRQDALGDIVLTLPILSVLKQHDATCHISLLCKKAFHPLLDNHPDIDELLALPPKTNQSALRSLLVGFDCVIIPNLEPHVIKAAKDAGIPCRIGDSNRILMAHMLTHGVALDYHDPRRHVVSLNLDLLRPFLAAIPDDIPASLVTCDDGDKRMKARLTRQGWRGDQVITIQPCTGGSDDEWPRADYVSLINLITANSDHEVVLIGAGEREEAIIQEISDECDKTPLKMTGFGTFPELKSLFKMSHVVVGTNTGPLHVAAALGVPVVSLFPTTFIKPTQWGPWRTPHRVVRHDISPDHVFRDMQDLIKHPVLRTLREDTEYWFRHTMNIVICSDNASPKALNRWMDRCQRLHLRINHVRISPWDLLGWIRAIKTHDINLIHVPSGYVPIMIRLARLIAALKMSAPPRLVTASISEDLLRKSDKEIIDIYLN